MSTPFNNKFPTVINNRFEGYWKKLATYGRSPWFKLISAVVIVYMVTNANFEFSVYIGQKQLKDAAASIIPIDVEIKSTATPAKKENSAMPKAVAVKLEEEKSNIPLSQKNKKENVSPSQTLWWETARDYSHKLPTEAEIKKTKAKVISIEEELNLANPATAVSDALSPEQKKKAAKYSALGLILNPDLAAKEDPAIVNAKNKIVYDYIATYLPIAQETAEKHNIPVSITLAQGLLESNAGTSKLAKRDNNHFGIKCKLKCLGCRCANYTDDSKFDMFRIFETPQESFKEHSLLLTNPRYNHLLKLPRTDYENWAFGLKSAGYATDPKYAQKLITIIEILKLNRFDR